MICRKYSGYTNCCVTHWKKILIFFIRSKRIQAWVFVSILVNWVLAVRYHRGMNYSPRFARDFLPGKLFLRALIKRMTILHCALSGILRQLFVNQLLK